MCSMGGLGVDSSGGDAALVFLLFGNLFKDVPALAESPGAGTALHIFDSVSTSKVGILLVLIMRCIL
jgi:hypothetical protein